MDEQTEQTGMAVSEPGPEVEAPETFYRDFETRFRGDREIIVSRLRAYAPFIRPLATQGDARALDLGCGRGEWLELLGEWGVQARGVDLDAGMLLEAEARGLSVEREDALRALRAVPDGDLTVISGFHVAEHLPFEVLRALLTEARRALRPGGVLIMETPNPENPLVGLINFHLDATHVRPLPPVLMSFLAEYSGFARHSILRLQGATPRPETAADLSSLLTDVSLDYAVVAQVAGPEMAALDQAFARTLGLSLEAGVARFDRARADRQTEMASALRAELTSELLKEIVDLRAEVDAVRYRLDRSWIEHVLFRPSGRPIRAFRRLMFHTSGKPRGVFRRWIWDADRNPRPAFRRWMTSPEYLALRWPASRCPRAALEETPLLPDGSSTGALTDHPLRAELLARLNVLAARSLAGRSEKSN